MALRFVFDRVENALIRDSIDGLEIVRRCLVFDIPAEVAGAGYRAMTSIILDPQCPKLRSAFPDSRVTGVQLEERRLVAIQQQLRRAELDLVYRGGFNDPTGSDQIIWTVSDFGQSNHVTVYATAGGKIRLGTWYKQGAGTVGPQKHDTDPTGSFDPSYAAQGSGMHRVLVFRGLRVTGRATGTQWRAIRKQIRALKGHINKATWGEDPRGTWLFLYPNATTIDRGNTYDIELNFLGDDNGHFPVIPYTDPTTGHIPPDISTEQNLRSLGLPSEGGIVVANGFTLASNYPEGDFTVFRFDPDSPPTPG